MITRLFPPSLFPAAVPRSLQHTWPTRHRLALLLLVASAAATAQAEVKPNSLFAPGAVLQQGMAVPVWGTGRDGEKVTVKFQDQTVSTTAQAGRWLVRLQALPAGGPFTLDIAGDNHLTITNVLVGEVWLCSGQSNMGFPLSRAANAREAIAAATDPELRLYTVPHEAKDTPQTDAPGRWQAATSESAAGFSAVAYFFGRDLRRALKVPVGLINSSVGGTPAEAWTSRATLEADPELAEILARHAENARKFDPAKAATQHQAAMAKYQAALKKARTEGAVAPTAPRAPANPARSSQRPCGLYNAMIAPLEPYALAGVIWYQGEANAGRAAQYRKLFPALIGNWRQAWGQGDFPFLFVQIAPHQNMTPEMREAQLWTAQRVPRTAMAVITDLGDEKDIHPTRKEPVGARLALAARALAYGEKLEYSGPVFAALRIDGDRAVLSFTHVGGGLEARDGELKGFTLANADGVFVPATARIEGDTVVVSSASVAHPVAVRYGWAKTPQVNLFNRAGLPATPFRTDAK
jgi:sialate O-acetylesterase